jgi:F-type H+-transporting ATPase subunit alpha
MGPIKEVGFSISVNDYLITLEGLPSAKVNDVVISELGERAIVNSLEGNYLQALLLESRHPKPGEMFYLDDGGIKLPLCDGLLGRTVNPLGAPIDGKAPLPKDRQKLELDVVALGIAERELITDQLSTGFTVVDTLLPIAKGQRELIIGDARSGKSTFLLDIIINQKGKNVICVYGAVGKSEIGIKRFAAAISQAGASEYTTILAATSSSPTPLITIAPSVAFSVAEYFCSKGRDVLLILDDLGVHARYLREIALISKQIPGRESYPGGIFHAHSHLMERAGRFKGNNGASITLLPVIENDLENFTNLIPTNLMSQTDGHLLFSSNLRAQGQYPAIEWDRSVTRVGRQTQPNLLKTLGSRVRALLAEYQELKRYITFEAEISGDSQLKIKQAEMVLEVLRQENEEALEPKIQATLLATIFTRFMNDKTPQSLHLNKRKIIKALRSDPVLTQIVETEKDSLEHLIERLDSNSDILLKAMPNQ